MHIGVPAEINRSDACFSAINLSTGVRNMASLAADSSRGVREAAVHPLCT